MKRSLIGVAVVGAGLYAGWRWITEPVTPPAIARTPSHEEMSFRSDSREYLADAMDRLLDEDIAAHIATVHADCKLLAGLMKPYITQQQADDYDAKYASLHADEAEPLAYGRISPYRAVRMTAEQIEQARLDEELAPTINARINAAAQAMQIVNYAAAHPAYFARRPL